MPRANAWQRWLRQPQRTAFRKAVFQVHLWAGIGLGLYVVFISVTGSVLVYRNELYAAAMPNPGVNFDSAETTGLYAVFGLAPSAMFVTGSIMWWNRVLRRWPGRRTHER